MPIDELLLPCRHFWRRARNKILYITAGKVEVPKISASGLR